MKVVTRIDFLKYPEGTIYSKGKEWYFEDICIKGDTIELDEKYPLFDGDWYYLCTSWPNAMNSNSAFDILEKSLEEKTSFPCEAAYQRDGMFDPDDLFLIYEKSDLGQLREHIDAAIMLA